MNFTKDQEKALEIMRSGSNCFITGEAGTGKSFVVQAYIDELRSSGKEVLITAPTGTAADNLGGMTIHRAFGAPIGVIPPKEITTRDEVLECVDVIIIDEISMCRFDLFDFVARKILFENDERNRNRYMAEMSGGESKDDIQIIVMGDFFQLPPVITPNDKDALNMFYQNYGKGFAFNSKYWQKMGFDGICLKENIRQEDAAFKKILVKIRNGEDKIPCAAWLKSHASDFPFDDTESIYLSSTNKDVNTINTHQLAKLDEKEHVFYASVKGDITATEKFAEDELHLKIGCKVMMTINDSEGQFVNGTIGTVEGIYDLFDVTDIRVYIPSKELYISVSPITKEIIRPKVTEKEKTVTEIDENGNTVKKKKTVKVLEDEVVGSFTQYPLKLAYAITIHKSQGKTFEKMNMNPYCWDEGQFYTGISRCKRIENICFTQEIKSKYIKASAEVIRAMKGVMS